MQSGNERHGIRCSRELGADSQATRSERADETRSAYRETRPGSLCNAGIARPTGHSQRLEYHTQGKTIFLPIRHRGGLARPLVREAFECSQRNTQ